MPQHDLVIDGGLASGLTVRTDINGALAALGSLQKGPNAPPALQAGLLWLDDDTPSTTIWTLRVYDGATWIPVLTIDTVNDTVALASAPATNGFRNLLFNPGFEIWQRNASFAVPAASGGYTADRWAVLTGAGAALTVARQAGLAATSQFCARVQRNAGQSGTGDIILEQALETVDVIRARGRKLSVTLDARRGGNYSGGSNLLLVRVYAGTGTERRRGSTPFTAEAVLLNSSASLGLANGTFTFTTTAAVPAGATQLCLQVVQQPTGTAGANDWFEIDSAQLEISDLPTAYEERPLAVELDMLQRFFQRLTHTIASPVAGSASVTVQMQPPMRAAPTVTAGLISQINASIWATTVLNAGAVQVDASFTSTGFSQRTLDFDAELA